MHDCENCGQHTRDCRCDTPCPKCGPECDCEPAREPGTITCLCCYEPDMTHIDAEGCFCECHLPGGSNVGRCGEMLSDSREGER